MIEFIEGERYIVSSQWPGLFVGTFDLATRASLRFSSVVVLLGDGDGPCGEAVVPKRRLIDAERWVQRIALEDCTYTDVARDEAESLLSRKSTVVRRANGRAK